MMLESFKRCFDKQFDGTILYHLTLLTPFWAAGSALKLLAIAGAITRHFALPSNPK